MKKTFFLFLIGLQLYSADSLQEQYEKGCSQPSDINEHLPQLRELAKECQSVTELGVRGMISTWAILQGLSESPYIPHSYRGVDLVCPPLNTFYLANNLAEMHQISFQFIEGNDFDIDIENTDMLFIDTWHTYRHLTYELEKFSPKVNKFITMHDTSDPYGTEDEPFYVGVMPEYPSHINPHKKGLWMAVEDFLLGHPEWRLKARYLNNHGFTVLERVLKRERGK